MTHVSVMTAEVLRYLDCKPAGVYVDATLGGAGHALAILKAAQGLRLIGLDVDEDALKESGRVLEPYKDRVLLLRENFKDIIEVLKVLGIEKIDGMVLDVGVSSYQLEKGERGFSFLKDARLDMRMDTRNVSTAYDLVNALSEGELETIFRSYGEERRARAIARAIGKKRKLKPIETTAELANLAARCYPPALRHRGIHPATRVFQALRIAVNDELENLERGLRDGMEMLGSGGRMVVISFHSLEDRIVKTLFKEFSSGCVCPRDFLKCVCGRAPVAKILTKKAVMPTHEEVGKNPRSRSARLRAIEKI